MDPDVMSFVNHSLSAATFTPYKEDGSVDTALILPHSQALAKSKVPFAFINGTTGDSMSLSVAERKAVAEAWVAARASTGVAVMNHIGAASISDSKELAAHAASIGCEAISAMPPYFFTTNSPAIIAAWLKEIGAAAPKTPLYYYHFPAITGCWVDPAALLRAIEEVGVPSFRGMKFTEYNLWHYANCVNHAGAAYDMCYGRDEGMLGGLATGAKGSIGNAFCFNAGTYHRLRAAFFAGDMKTAQKEQARANAVVNIMSDAKHGGNGLVVARYIMELKGIKMGPPRIPHMPLTAAHKEAVAAALKEIGFFEWCE